jgi:hypothetical protein
MSNIVSAPNPQNTVTVTIICQLLTETQIPWPHIFSFRSNLSGAIEGSQFKTYPAVVESIQYHHSLFMYLKYTDLKLKNVPTLTVVKLKYGIVSTWHFYLYHNL